MAKYKNLDPIDQEEKKQNILVNMRAILFYALSLSVAMGFNDLIMSIFSSFPDTQNIIAKTTYVMIMFGATIFAAYLLSGTIKA